MKLQSLADTIFHFANETDLERALSGFNSLLWAVYPATLSRDGSKVWRLHGPPEKCWGYFEAVAEDQKDLRKLLRRLANSGPTVALWRLLRTGSRINEVVGDTWVGKKIGEIEGYVDVHPASIEGWYCTALAELIAGGHGDSIRLCEKEGCDNFFVASNPSGRPRRFCSESHASQARVARKRKRDLNKGPA